jgi:hypothetical protein
MTPSDLIQLLEFFPLVELPITFSEAAIRDISSTNKPLPAKYVHHILTEWEHNIDEFTEVIPCVSLPEGEDHFTIIYWKADLLTREYVLVTLDKRDISLISRKVIAGMKTDGERIIQSVANIEDDQIINVMAGEVSHNGHYDPMSSNAFTMEVLPGGNIYSQKEDEPLAWVEKKTSTEKK